MSAIGPGDFVECVDNAPIRPDDAPYCQLLVLGGLYQVSWCGLSERGPRRGAPILRLVGIVMPFGKRGYGAFRFRPIYRPKSDLIETLKQPAPDAVRELEEA